jgi:hypothetical protein
MQFKMNKSEAYLPQPISSISKVPIEIFAEIFLHVVSDTGEQLEGTQSSTDQSTASHTSSYRSCASPFSLSHVCHNWRILSLSLPALWTNLRVICPRNNKLVFLLSTWIKRACMRSLNLSLKQPLLSGTNNDMRGNEIDSDFQATKGVWELFLSVMDRWGSLEVDVRMSFETLTKGAGDFIGRNWFVPIKLESIKVSFGADIAGHGKDLALGAQLSRQSQGYHQKLDEITFFACLLHCSPRLRSAEWDNKHVCLHLGLVSQLWDTLTELTLFTSQDIPSLILSLSKCQSLRKLTIHEQSSVDRSLHGTHVHGTGSDLDPACTSVTLRNLQMLTLGTFANPEMFFSHLTVPNLHTLIIVNGRNGKKGWRGLSRDAWFALSEMLGRSSEAELTTLIVGGLSLTGRDSLMIDDR